MSDVESKKSLVLCNVVPDANAIMGVKAVFGAISSHVLCFGARGNINGRSFFPWLRARRGAL
jgi:hypothetical protein